MYKQQLVCFVASQGFLFFSFFSSLWCLWWEFYLFSIVGSSSVKRSVLEFNCHDRGFLSKYVLWRIRGLKFPINAQKLKFRGKSSRQKLKFLIRLRFKVQTSRIYAEYCTRIYTKANLYENLAHADNFVHHCIFREVDGYWLSVDYRFYRAKSLMIELLASRGIEGTTSLESICIEKLFERRRKITYSIKDIDRRPLRSKQQAAWAWNMSFYLQCAIQHVHRVISLHEISIFTSLSYIAEERCK